jgi:hypothetical protein
LGLEGDSLGAALAANKDAMDSAVTSLIGIDLAGLVEGF